MSLDLWALRAALNDPSTPLPSRDELLELADLAISTEAECRGTRAAWKAVLDMAGVTEDLRADYAIEQLVRLAQQVHDDRTAQRAAYAKASAMAEVVGRAVLWREDPELGRALDLGWAVDQYVASQRRG